MPISRRRLLRNSGTLCAVAASKLLQAEVTATAEADVAGKSEGGLVDESVVRLSAQIRKREISSHEVVKAFLDRIAEVNGKLNAVVQLRTQEALKAANSRDMELAKGRIRGPLHGVPFTIKDSFDTQGLVSSAGTSGRAKFVPKQDATVVQRIREAGGILLGKTNTPELTLSYETSNRIYGTTYNPYDLSRTPGGSSGGAAAILAASGSPLDIGSDSAGSLRLPAHFCGVASLKPSSGRVPRTGHIISFSGPLQALTHVGPMARYVQDLKLVLSIVAGVDAFDPHIVPRAMKGTTTDLAPLRVAYFPDNGRCTPTDATRSTIDSVASLLKSQVASTKRVFPRFLDEAAGLYGKLVAADGFQWAKRILDASKTKPESVTLPMIRKPPRAKTSAEFTELVEQWHQIKSRSLRFWRDFDVLICPVAAAPAHKSRQAAPKSSFSYSAAINVTGWPSVVVRAGTSPEGLPIGVQVLAPMWREDRALAVAELIEQKLGGWQPCQLAKGSG